MPVTDVNRSGAGSLSGKNQAISILYVDDEPDLLTLGKVFLEHSGQFKVTTRTSAIEALHSHEIRTYDAIVSDFQMSDMDGIAFLKAVRENYGDIPFILITGHGREEVVIEAINNGANFYIKKSGDLKELFVELSQKIHLAVKSNPADKIFKESVKTLSDIIDFLPEPTFAIDRSGKVIAWNRAIEELTAFSSSDMLGKADFEYAIPLYGSRRPLLINLIDESDEKIAQYYSNWYWTGNSLTAETYLPLLKGNGVPTLIKVCRLYNQAGDIIGAIESIRDITEVKRTELELSRAMRLIQTVSNSTSAFLALLDYQGKILFANQAFSVQTGIPDFSVTRVSIMDFFPSVKKKKGRTIFSDIVRSKSPSLHEFPFLGRDGTIVLSVLFFPIQADDNFLIGFIGLNFQERNDFLIKLDETFVRDHLLESSVQEKTKDLSRLLDLKDSLITEFAHELRVPLTPLKTLLPLLVEEDDYPKRAEIIRVIEKSTTRIANIVEKILSLANIGTISVDGDISEINIYSVVENVLEMYNITADKKEITIMNDIPSDITLYTSLPHLVSVLDNVISNAVKYSKIGGIIRISCEKKFYHIVLSVMDDGIGMTRGELIRVFEPFFKADSSGYDPSSPGLGLSITKRLIQDIGGDISIFSDGPDKGTEVILFFNNKSSVA
jgi:PAS domain S-box-containing protein